VGYVGRFAPSPTGPLHEGSIVAAVASFLHARQAGGEWLVRIEDIDPPREVPGAADDILRTLERLGLEWDRKVLYQSSRLPEYRDTAERLLASGAAFRCACSRTAIRLSNEAGPARYPGTCRNRQLPATGTAVRMLAREPTLIAFEDGLQGPQKTRLDSTMGDYVILRRDRLPAYHLAVVIDDALQGVTDIVRGTDLLDSTPAHLHLQQALSLPSPVYWHLPVVVNAQGQKLSKQTGAAPVGSDASAVAIKALARLGLEVPEKARGEPPRVLWRWAEAVWQVQSLRGKRVLGTQH
jgi:glutamyl-Q tRNA(Asp) synthetase